jgi:hypothetical protein
MRYKRIHHIFNVYSGLLDLKTPDFTKRTFMNEQQTTVSNIPLTANQQCQLSTRPVTVHNPKTPLIDGIKAVDWAGTVKILALTVMVLLGLDFGGQVFAWSSPKVICLIVFGALCGVSLF